MRAELLDSRTTKSPGQHEHRRPISAVWMGGDGCMSRRERIVRSIVRRRPPAGRRFVGGVALRQGLAVRKDRIADRSPAYKKISFPFTRQKTL
jgi:hypothetical protein